MSGEATAERIDPARDRIPRWPTAGGALLVLSLLACMSLWDAPAQAGFPGANGKIFCEGLNDRATGTGDLEIFSVNADGSAYTPVTNNGPLIDPGIPTSFLTDQNPAVSPDGKRVAWSTNRDGGSRIYIKNADGTGPETVLTTEGVARVHSWSPDSRQIYFNNNLEGFPGNNEVYRMNADGTGQTNLTNRATSDVAPAVKPDGTKVLFHSNRNLGTNDFDIHAMNPDGTNVVNLTNNRAGNDLDPNWKPDGTQIVFERFASGSNSNIFKMNADGSGVTQLTFQAAGLNRNPVWSPDGTRIAFDSGRDTAAGQPNNQEVYT
ncbi:MAG: TolB family protein, partial [Pseudonocardiaceae bacterium]